MNFTKKIPILLICDSVFYSHFDNFILYPLTDQIQLKHFSDMNEFILHLKNTQMLEGFECQPCYKNVQSNVCFSNCSAFLAGFIPLKWPQTV